MAWKKSNDFNVNEEQGNVTSRLNSAGLINATLERLWTESHNAMCNGEYLKWNSKLDAIWVILGGDCDNNGAEEKFINEIDLKIYNTGSLKAKTGTGFEKKDNPNNAIQYILLKKKSIYLRRLQNRQGKGTAYASDDDDDI